jgi:transcriptional regulator with XRE-family HTH domain
MVVDEETRAQQRLVAELRRVKQASGLSFARLQAHTPYSRSSLERYVNGKLFPTRQAVREIARACGADPEELLRIWDVAAAEDRLATTPNRQDQTLRRPRNRRFPAAAMVLCLAALVLTVINGDQYVSRSSTPISVPQAVEPQEIWSRRLSVVTADDAKDGWLEVTLDWRGNGPFDGRIYGSVHVREKGDLCAAAYAWYDGKVAAIGQACGRKADSAVFGDFRHTWRALVEVCLRRGSAKDPQWCSAWS